MEAWTLSQPCPRTSVYMYSCDKTSGQAECRMNDGADALPTMTTAPFHQPHSRSHQVRAHQCWEKCSANSVPPFHNTARYYYLLC